MQIMKQSSIKGLFLPAIALCSLLLSGNAAHAASGDVFVYGRCQ